MSFELWISFVIASAALLAIPGPTVMLVVSYALNKGRSSGWATVPGVTLGDFTAMTASLLGAGAILAASAILFTILKLAGAAYLVWIGFKLWKAKPNLESLQETNTSDSNFKMFWNSYVVTALNPKGIIFFVAFVPQFIDPLAPAFSQFILLEATFLALAAANVAVWAVLAGKLRTHFKKERTLRLVNRGGATCLISAGFLTAIIGRNS